MRKAEIYYKDQLAEELALTMDGKKRKLGLEHFKQFGKGLGLSVRQIEGSFKRFSKNKSKAIEWINNSFLSDEMKAAYKEVLNERYAWLNTSFLR